MKPRWDNIFALGLIVFSLLLLTSYPVQISSFLRSVEYAGPDHMPDEQLMGLMAFGLIAISLLGAIKIVLQRNSKKGGDD